MLYKILPLFIPFSGCKDICLYCNQEDITGNTENNNLSNLKEQLHCYLDKNIQWNEIAIYGGTFTGLSQSLQIELLTYLSEHVPDLPIRISTRPDYIDIDTLKILKQYNVKTIELGIQSMAENVLLSNNRFYSEKVVIKSMKDIIDNSFTLGVQIMCGLFNEQISDYIYTVNTLKNLTFSYVRIYPTIVLKNTQLEELFRNKKYTPLSIVEAISYCAYGFIKFLSSGKNIIRMGLHNSRILEDSIVAGPYHKSFGDVVKIYILFLYLLKRYRIIIGENDRSLIFGYSGFINKLFTNKITISNKKRTNWTIICETLENEDNFWILKEQTDLFEKEFFN
jgi:histone acetyltransferase (RNA polymerase elongator complex component)